ncbi:hypothetical protein EWM64_g9686, partial [Hericium alpestre]
MQSATSQAQNAASLSSWEAGDSQALVPIFGPGKIPINPRSRKNKQKAWAVFIGRHLGIYLTWEDAERQVHRAVAWLLIKKFTYKLALSGQLPDDLPANLTLSDTDKESDHKGDSEEDRKQKELIFDQVCVKVVRWFQDHVRKLEAQSGSSADTAGVKTGFRGTIKKEYLQVKDICSRSLFGFGWDLIQMIVVVPDEVWAPLIKSCPHLAKWKKRLFPLYDNMADLVDGHVASGIHAFNPSANPPASQSQFCTLDDSDEEDKEEPNGNEEDEDEVELSDIQASAAPPATPTIQKMHKHAASEVDSASPAPSSKRVRPTIKDAVFKMAMSISTLADAVAQ